MTMTKHLLLLFTLFLLSAAAGAQPLFVPDMEIKKVGEVAFQQPKRISFGFSNKGTAPLRILLAHPSCGCVDVSFTKGDINPGQRGEVVMTYDAAMLGVFHKEVELLTNASPEPIYLLMEGTVVTEVTDYGTDFPIDLGNVRLETNCLEFDDVNKGDKPVAVLRFLNAERTAFHPELMHLPPYLTVKFEPENVAPGKVGKAVITLDSEKLMQMGLNQTSIYFARYLGDKVSDTNEILLSAILLPDFSGMTEAELAKAPVLYVSESELDLGSMGTKKSLKRTIPIFNMGKSDLHIRHVQVFNRSISVSVSNQVIKPGKSVKVKVSVLKEYLSKAKGAMRVLFITDDPSHPKQIVDIKVKP